jgi:transketolase
MGISENDMVGVAAGLSLTGYIPFLSTFSVFATSLAHQAIRLSVAYNRANVKIAVSHGGITVGPDGATHQAFDDISLMRCIPGMTIIVPADANQAYDATIASAEHHGPVFIRLARGATNILPNNNPEFTIGAGYITLPGSDVAIFATGIAVELSVSAATQLRYLGVSAAVINVSTIKPLPEELILDFAETCGAIVTVEEHSIIGGLGDAVCGLLARRRPTPVEFVGVEDTFGESGEPEQILNHYGITTDHVVSAVKQVLERK